DYVPFTVRPPHHRATAEIGLLLPTFTYLAYGNERLLETSEPLREGAVFDALKADPRDAEWRQHPEFGLSLYDTHADGSGCCYATALRPILNMRPDYRLWATGAPRFLGGDLYMTDWLREKGFAADVFTDHDLHFDGEALLRRYRVVITGGHPEYWSGQMLDAMQAYLDGGGRVMYLGGNGFYWVASLDRTNPAIIEVRRGNAATRVWESLPGEAYHSTTGELGGIWRHRGKLPNELVGMGYASLGYSYPSPGYARNPAASGPIVEMVFEGVDEDPFGEYGLVLGGAAGDEIDRVDPRRGSPDHTILLASSTGYGDDYMLTHEEVMITTAGLGGSENPGVRSDVAFMETANGGAVFSAGAISWRGSLSHSGYDNGVSRITENVLRAFLTTEEWPSS
ncbi:MAG TPA: N,N-dimethylformamidase beta subunit family domain-containing protein, partial [Solirubrobacterales bacterium]|nr:N,N-dimethylformamidase beta subunit family domain-containing protein [Solirubrobacterales bacterium]